jgi:hypothetical protein
MTFRRSIENKVPSPNVVDPFDSQAVTSVLGLAFRSLFIGFLTHFQTLSSPDSMHSLKAHSKTLKAKQSRHLTVAKPRTLPRHFMQPFSNHCFIILVTTAVTDAGS